MHDINQAPGGDRIERRVVVDGGLDSAWALLDDPRLRAEWLGESDLDLRPGASGLLVEPDGEVRRVEVLDCVPGQALTWRWMRLDGTAPTSDGDWSTVTLTLLADPDEDATTITVVEQRGGGGPSALVAPASVVDVSIGESWDRRLLGLELAALGNRLTARC
jgi:uncharacterized protein YndB with AHSA1/START domain